MIQETEYYGWKSVKIDTGKVELIIPKEVGTRIIHCGLKDKANLFKTVEAELGKKHEDTWLLRGGHRLWHSPEDPIRTYVPDNEEIEVKTSKKSLSLMQNQEKETGILKRIDLEIINENTFKVTHSIKNVGLWNIETAAWALSVMNYGGYAVIALPQKGLHPRDLLPSYSIVPWTYTNFSFPIWSFKSNFIGVDSSKAKVAQKIGLTDYAGWLAYWQEAGTFVKYSPVQPKANYPDRGSVMEVFSNDEILELETLSPLTKLAPGKEITHTEYWVIFENLPKPDSDEVFEKSLSPKVNEWIESLD